MRWLFVALALGLGCSAQPAQAITGANLLEYCSAPAGGIDDTACIAYVIGLTEGLAFSKTVAPIRALQYCPPVGVTIGQSRLVIEKYLRNHPEELHKPAGLLASLALENSFPCKQNSN